MKDVILRSAAARVLSRIKAMTKEELKLALESCSEGPIGYAFSASQSYWPDCHTQQVVTFHMAMADRLLPYDYHATWNGVPLADNSCQIYDAANDSLYALAA